MTLMPAFYFTEEDRADCQRIMETVPGYSGELHYAFWKNLLTASPFKRMLMLGIYQGRDICMILSLLNLYWPNRELHITGVDKFTNDSCADWSVDKQGLTWEQAGYGAGPSVEGARKNIGETDRVTLLASRDIDFLRNTPDKFDCIYLDTSHDFKSVDGLLSNVSGVCDTYNTIIAGDDWCDYPGWGVKEAVAKHFTTYNVFGKYVWRGHLRHLKHQVTIGAMPTEEVLEGAP